MTESKGGRRLVGKRDLIIIAAVLVVAVIAIVYMQHSAGYEGNVAVITVDGEEAMRVYLEEFRGRSETLSLRESHGVPVDFFVDDGGIQFVNVTCPDHLCEAMGVCRGQFEWAACIPNGTALFVYAHDDLPAIG